MLTNNVKNNVDKYIINAVSRLNSLNHVNVTKKLTSHYNYGVEPPFIRDRFDIELESKAKNVQCQIVFDSSDYYLAPDIIIEKSVLDKSFDIPDIQVLLPGNDWDVTNEDCLYNWLENIVSKLKKPPKSPSPEPALEPQPTRPKRPRKNWDIFDIPDDSDDDFVIDHKKDGDSIMNSKTDFSDDDFAPTTSISLKKTPAIKPPVSKHSNTKNYGIFDFDEIMAEKPHEECAQKKRSRLASSVENLDFDRMDIETPSEKHDRIKKIDLVQTTKKRKLNQRSSASIAKQLEMDDQWGEQFMDLWKSKFSHHTLQFEQGSGPVTMYMSFKIDVKSEDWIQYTYDKQESLDKYKLDNQLPINYKLSRYKAVAPMIVHLDLLSGRLHVKLISVINTDERNSAGVDHIDLKYKFDRDTPILHELTRIKNDIKKQAIYFHLHQTKLIEKPGLLADV